MTPGRFPSPQFPGLLERCTFPPPGSTLACAVSGGPDSLALLVLARAGGCEVTAFHVDHGLRPDGADEAALVAAAAERFGAAFRARRALVADGPNLEARARAARFAVLPSDVATGHTMDDQAETILCNLLRGAGPDGLAGMRPGPTHPLLALRRAETAALCRDLGLRWVTDPSNDDPRHLRNRVRHELLPLCADIARRDPVPVLARQGRIARDETDLLDSLAEAAVPVVADAARLAGAPVALARRAVRRWLRQLGRGEPSGGRPGAPGHPPSGTEVARVLAVAAGEARGTELAGGLRISRHHGRLTAEVRPGRRAPDDDA